MVMMVPFSPICSRSVEQYVRGDQKECSKFKYKFTFLLTHSMHCNA